MSSIPPDLDGLHQLQDLNLAANDLVQFDQWRALDSLPSLASAELLTARKYTLCPDATTGAKRELLGVSRKGFVKRFDTLDPTLPDSQFAIFTEYATEILHVTVALGFSE